jgi:hypothetical protein
MIQKSFQEQGQEKEREEREDRDKEEREREARITKVWTLCDCSVVVLCVVLLSLVLIVR